ncbi:hypothetical protein GUJ93_ZPchr0012g22052 [Zizania palustris]|uniref:Reverse transcriptase zinc-binding domain-containing protein n=1 Tax=Zizania palustris TaxID=103762 RepID=A0A8J6BSU0_ZIZPA|nr:hypothetical protein GUJ93_ZPchr0012g22052 [Zizania palustris]
MVVLHADQKNVFYFKALLNTFSMSTGLKVNYSKSSLIPINVPDDQTQTLSATFSCKLESFPFTYLGLPLGLHKPRFKDFVPLLTKVDRRLAHTTLWLSMAGKLQLVNSVLSALPTYAMCSFKLLIKVVNQIDRARRNCLWRGFNSASPSHPRAAWNLVCRPKIKGGLGVINLRMQNIALLLKHLHKFASTQDIPWVRLVWRHYQTSLSALLLGSLKGSRWWRDVVQLAPFFLGIARPILGNGTVIAFWEDCWLLGPLKHVFPRLYSFAKFKGSSVNHFLSLPISEDNFSRPFTPEALLEFHQLLVLLEHSVPQHHPPDSWTFIWGSSTFSPRRYYAHQFLHLRPHAIFTWLWASKCSNKLKVFFWLLLNGRLYSKSLLRRRCILPAHSDLSCALCQQGLEETSCHLFFECPFSLVCWNELRISWCSDRSVEIKLETARAAFARPFFMEVVIITSWTI